jgi:hypothetical protein
MITLTLATIPGATLAPVGVAGAVVARASSAHPATLTPHRPVHSPTRLVQSQIMV